MATEMLASRYRRAWMPAFLAAYLLERVRPGMYDPMSVRFYLISGRQCTWALQR
jgi:hypothetical protein